LTWSDSCHDDLLTWNDYHSDETYDPWNLHCRIVYVPLCASVTGRYVSRCARQYG
jgi:hypothetical protein